MFSRAADPLESCADVMAASVPIALDRGDDGVLLCHGFTGTTTTMRFWAESLADAGYSVRVPRLPGHGTRWQEMNRVAWTDWVTCVDDAYRELASRCRRVAIAGLSMGGGLALRLAELHPEIVAVMLVNPAIYAADPSWRILPAFARVVPARYAPGSDVKQISFPGITPDDLSYDYSPMPAALQMWDMWRTIRAGLPQVAQPLLVFKSDVDHVVDPTSVELIRAGVRSSDVTVTALANSYHVATVDNDAELIFAQSRTWLAERLEGTR